MLFIILFCLSLFPPPVLCIAMCLYVVLQVKNKKDRGRIADKRKPQSFQSFSSLQCMVS